MRQLALVFGVIAVMASWYAADEFSLIGVLVFSAYIFSPWAFLAFGAGSLRSPARGIAIFVVAAIAGAVYVSAFTHDPAWAALGLLWAPPAQWTAVGLALGFRPPARPSANP